MSIEEKVVLIIGRSSSTCDACGANTAIKNICTPIGLDPIPESCGAIYTHVTSYYWDGNGNKWLDKIGGELGLKVLP